MTVADLTARTSVGIGRRTPEQRSLNAVQRPEAYRELVISSAGAPIVLSVWNGSAALPVMVFLPGTMTHPLFYEEFLDALNRSACTAKATARVPAFGHR
jgi:hypothetical protein